MALPLLGFLKVFFAPAKIAAGASAVFRFIADNWKALSIAAMIGIIFYQNFLEHRFVFGLNTIPHLQAEVDRLQADIEVYKNNFDTCMASNQLLREMLDKQSEQITLFGEATKGFEEQFNELTGTLEEMRQDTNQTVEDILNRPPPENCEAAMDYLREAAKGGFIWNQ